MPVQRVLKTFNSAWIAGPNWTNVQAAGGDGTFSIWQNQTIGTSYATRPTLMHSVTSNKARTVRRSRVIAKIPEVYTDTTTGLKKVANTCTVDITVTVPSGIDTAMVKERLSEVFTALVTLSNDPATRNELLIAIAEGTSMQ